MKSSRLGWKEIAEALGVLGVIGSLVFVALEIRLNTNAVRSATIQAISDQSYDFIMRMAENPELRAVQRAADNGEKLTTEQHDAIYAVYGALMRVQQNRFMQLRLGVLDEETIFQVGGRGRGYRSPYFAEFWAETRETYPPEFQNFIESQILSLSKPRNAE